MGALDTIGRSLLEGFYMFYDTLWALVLGFALSGAVQAFVSKRQMQRALGDHRPVTVVRSSFFGMVSSSCSYAASALAKSLFARGADFTSSMVFMFASTNLVIELGLVLWLLIGWQFAVAEFIGGIIMIAILATVLPHVVDVRAIDAARSRLTTGGDLENGNDSPAAIGVQGQGGRLIRTRAGWSEAAGYTISDVTMIRKELVFGFILAGFASIAVPVSVWQALFMTGNGFWSTLQNVIVGPVLAFVSFVCSIGNVPLAAALWKGGISFGGVIAFVFADLLALPLVLIYRRYYGTRLAVRLCLVFWAVMSTAGLLTELIFRAVGAIPPPAAGDIATTHIGWNYTTVLNIVAVGAFGYLYYLYKSAARLGAGAAYGKDPVCGMQVRRADAPARRSEAGTEYFFCSDRCGRKFDADPARYVSGRATASADAPTSQLVDPVCGMTVDGAAAPGHADYSGRQYVFCSTGCRDLFTSDPLAFVSHARDIVCGMEVEVATAGARAVVLGTDLVFCGAGCAAAAAAHPRRYLATTSTAPVGDDVDRDRGGPAPLVTDPVCGALVDAQTAESTLSAEGITVSFCSARCRAAFAADPSAHASEDAR